MARHATRFFRHTYFPALKRPERGRIYLFLGFGGMTTLYSPAILRFCRHGFSVVAFRFSVRGVLGMTTESLIRGIDDICQTVADYEANRTTKTQAIVFGNSMGSAYAWYVAQRTPSINKVVANSGYALISKMTFAWKRGMYPRLVQAGYDEAKFHRKIKDIEPVTHFDKLKGKRVLLCMNRDDQTISFEHAQIFKDSLAKNHIAYEYIENHGMRHAHAVARNLMSRRVLEFLKS